MNADERHHQSVALARQLGEVEVARLAAELNVSAETIRRDLRLLEKHGLLRRTHGGSKLGWSRVPSGKRTSTYSIPQYKDSAKAFADITLASIEHADPQNPGLQPRPTVGIQYVGIPEFEDLGTKVSQEISAAIAGSTTVDKALDDGQQQAETVAKTYQGK